jgi:hypothetical protein
MSATFDSLRNKPNSCDTKLSESPATSKDFCGSDSTCWLPSYDCRKLYKKVSLSGVMIAEMKLFDFRFRAESVKRRAQ